MRLTILLLFVNLLQISATGFAQTERFNLHLDKATIKEALTIIENQSSYKFVYRDSDIENKVVSTNLVNSSIDDVLKVMLTNTGSRFRILENNLIVIAPEEVLQQNKVIGTVVDAESGETLIGVSIFIKGTNQGSVTDVNGKFSLNISKPNSVLKITYMGYITEEIALKGQTRIDIKLVRDVKSLEEVVVVGYGTQKKANLTAAVDQVTSEVLKNRAVPNLTQMLQGVMPNLNIALGDGKPIQHPNYNIRGTTSIGQGGSALVLIDGVQGSPSMLNPNDVASVSILKDAASASIYGARGAFGVVLITTKNPEKGKTRVIYSSNYSIKSPIAVPDFVTDGYTYSKMFAESSVNRAGIFPQNINKTMKFSQEYLDEFEKRSKLGNYNQIEIDPTNGEYVYYANTDLYGELYKKTTGAIEQNISISGSSDKASYLISSRYLKQDGLFRYNTDDYNMKNFRAKGSIQVFPWLQIDNNVDYSERIYHNPMNVGEGNGIIWRNIADEGHPSAPIFNPDGTLTMSAAYGVGDFWYGKSGIDMKDIELRNTSGFTAQFFQNKFRIKGNFTFNNTNNSTTQKRVPVPYSNKPGEIEYVGTTTNDLRIEKTGTQYLATNLYAEYENTFLDSHYLKFMAGYNYEQSTYQGLSVQRNGLIYEDASDINLALGELIKTGGGWSKWNILGGFSRLNYSYKDRYLLEVNGRFDGSSKFPDNQRFVFFPSVSGGWRISKESFWKVSPKLFSDLKIRASYGSLGNGDIGSYAYQEQFTISQSGNILNGIRPQYTSRPTVLPDGITWEKATTSNIGLDFSMLSDRLRFVGDAYIRNTTDMYTIGLTLPALFGATSPKGNYSDLQTKGWELSLSWRDNFNVASKPLNYNFRFTLADNKSVITRYNNPDKMLSDYYEGQVIGEIWGYTTEGFFIDEAEIATHAKQSPQFEAASNKLWFPGDIKFKDVNLDGFINPGTNRISNPGDRTIIGNSRPRFTYGISLGAEWNNFFFSSFFQGVGKQDWYPSEEAEFFWGQYNRPYNNIPVFQLGNIWTPENTDAYFPRYMSRAAQYADSRTLAAPQTKYLQNIAYIRLKDIQIGYNLPKKLISKIGASDMTVYISGENLWSFSPLYNLTKHSLDVENTGSSDQLLYSGNAGDTYNYPMLKSISFGLRLVF